MSLMPKSIRWRIQLWYGLILLLVVVGFAALLYFWIRDSRFREIDADLVAKAQYLNAILRRFPFREFNGAGSDRPPPRDRLNWPLPPPPPPPNREGLLAELTLLKEGGRLVEGPNRPAYFAIWRADGSVLKKNYPADAVDPETVALVTEPNYFLSPHHGNERQYVMYGPFQSRILVGRHVRRERNDLNALAWQLAGVGFLVLTIGLAGGWLVSGRLLRPLAAISATASTLSANNLSGRIDSSQIDRELAELANILNATFDRLEKAFDQQTRFTADASHELRTPLTIMRTQLEHSLARPRTPEQYRETMQTCQRATTRMTILVEELLALARADAGKLEMQREPVLLSELVQEVISLLKPLADQHQLTWNVDLDPVQCLADEARLRQVIINLLTNAIQYNRPGGSIRIRLYREQDQLVLEIADTGIGIPAEDLPHIFERFYRVDKARTRKIGGNGLGLAISKVIIDQLGGTLGVVSEPEKGSTFTIRLPALREGITEPAN